MMHVIHTNAKLSEGLSVLGDTPHVTVTFGDINIHVMGQYHNIEPHVAFHVVEGKEFLKLVLTREDLMALIRHSGQSETNNA